MNDDKAKGIGTVIDVTLHDNGAYDAIVRHHETGELHTHKFEAGSKPLQPGDDIGAPAPAAAIAPSKPRQAVSGGVTSGADHD